MSHEKMWMFLELKLSVVLSKTHTHTNVYMYLCHIPNAVRNSVVSLCVPKLLIRTTSEGISSQFLNCILDQWFSTWGTSTPGIREYVLGGTRKHMNQNEIQESLESWTSSDLRTHEDSSPNWGNCMPEICSIISLTGQTHVNDWWHI
jgi:hypothetical protein